MKVCRICGSNEDIHRGLCRRCRRSDQAQRDTERERHPKEPRLEPPHARPWVHRGSGTA